MKLLRTVVIKQVVTKEKKAEMMEEFEIKIRQSEREIEQLTFQLHKATINNKNKHEDLSLRTRYENEIETRKENLISISFKVQQLNMLELGTEINAGTVESMIDVQVGDEWPDSDEHDEIIINNGIVQEIRESRNEHD